MDKIINALIQAVLIYCAFLLYEYLKSKNSPIINKILKILRIIFYIIFAGVYILMIWALIGYIFEGNMEATISILIPFILLTFFGGINLYLKYKNN